MKRWHIEETQWTPFSEVVEVVPSLDTADTIVKEKRKKKKEVVVVEG